MPCLTLRHATNIFSIECAYNTDVDVDPKGHINALSCSGPKMMFNAELAVNDANLPARCTLDHYCNVSSLLHSPSL